MIKRRNIKNFLNGILNNRLRKEEEYLRNPNLVKVENLTSSGFSFVVLYADRHDDEIYSTWIESRNDLLSVIFPKKVTRQRITELKRRFPEAFLLSSRFDFDEHKNRSGIIIVDVSTDDFMHKILSAADLMYMGGGFAAGVEDILTASAYGIAIMCGPNHGKNVNVQDLKALGGVQTVVSADSFVRNANRLLYDITARQTLGRFAKEYYLETLHRK